MVPQRVSLITIGAFDLPALRLFYQQLGWAELDFSSDTYAVFNTAGVLLTLFPVSELADDAGVEIKQSAEIYNNVTLAINVETPELVDAAIAKIQEAGGKILRMPTEAVLGREDILFR
ncbi:VOC family protein [Peribacillus psychrosaccharolyticus]|uniref:VOC family protein n=1 Tax=Peribacillus psychrosaccharolyticus TaxID=1407 RepID=UPI0002ECC0F0|nr:VOC family protein [Peribacillus psychrosaccharolyticus]